MSIITLKPGDTVTVIAEGPLTTWGGGGERFPTNPIAGFDPIHGTWPTPQPPLGTWGGGGERFPTNPIAGFDPIHGTWPDKPPPTQPPAQDSGNWVWAWSPQAGRWVWVKVPGEGEAGPKT